MKPIFIFALPRSGSTLLQRIIATNPTISTLSEPGILLPLLYSTKDYGVYSEYGHQVTSKAIKEFSETIAGGRKAFLLNLHDFTVRLYQLAAGDSSYYFLDKTPRYHLVAEEILEIFPEGKFILLWRNPLSIISSIIETWGHGKWNIFNYRIDIYDGFRNLVQLQREYGKGICVVNYENLVNQPEQEILQVFSYLQVEYDPLILDQFSKVKLSGTWGDRTGVKRYKTLSKEPLNKWKYTFHNPYRKLWAKRYLEWIGKEDLRFIGYELDKLISDLSNTETNFKFFLSDIALAFYGHAYCLLEPQILKRKFTEYHGIEFINKHG